MYKKYNKLAMQAFWCLMIFCLLLRCTPIDQHYKDFLDNAEKAYPGRVDSVVFLSGYNRGAIRSLISTDPRVVRMQIRWGDKHVFDANIAPDEIAKNKTVLIPEIEEGTYTFDIRTFDAEGNQSMRTEVLGTSYGAIYSANLNNRIVDNIRQTEEGITVNWFPESADSSLLGTVISYITNTGDSARIFTGSNVNETFLPQFESTTELSFHTLYKPTSLAIDTFYAARQIINPVDYITTERILHPKESWSIVAASSEEPNNNRLADRLIDGDVTTSWITRYSSNPTDYPDHWITVDMGETRDVDGFFFAQKNGDRKISELEIQISNNNESWESIGFFSLAAIDREYQYIDLKQQKSFRYFKLIPRSGHDAQRQPGLAEVGSYYY
ncbi:DUF4998 domain-containing protein [Olivibacter sp. CPCC 100613]|uniref:DUF4998 domain-containing protein n=1 Tax=Olivibacter sp. CPCC 100613 TaxID=3079931 RepID=UPI002FFAED13